MSDECTLCGHPEVAETIEVNGESINRCRRCSPHESPGRQVQNVIAVVILATACFVGSALRVAHYWFGWFEWWGIEMHYLLYWITTGAAHLYIVLIVTLLVVVAADRRVVDDE